MMTTKPTSHTKILKSIWSSSSSSNGLLLEEEEREEEPISLQQQLEEERLLLQILELEIRQLRKQRMAVVERVQVLRYLLGERKSLANPLAPSANIPYHLKELAEGTTQSQ